jgi:hypothetical protein
VLLRHDATARIILMEQETRRSISFFSMFLFEKSIAVFLLFYPCILDIEICPFHNQTNAFEEKILPGIFRRKIRIWA